ncbi:hypothetical protein EDI_106670 [Entamoeba dispar SAW760]|uniref:Uncharacterized protein n=1 Tax=Entamoeba dispar (strain ATCC PRA-260 / SAW760) TaxID=370354 RepID=B0ET45_ENTDS|nr:uncharacterized protein EDI_106670 [Entamoeba dispar SAW760]EDR22298.1 hypothetical protein EDI_106670 [Entamoeba dispar SAW760]|eukprot:EDR22298.1 hypothetical protein EDI_106670 [Entamoeba dispar SAW760]
MFSKVSHLLMTNNDYGYLPKETKRLGYYNTPYVITQPHGEFNEDSAIIYCHSIKETFEQSIESIHLIAEITKMQVLCFEYCGFYEGSTYSKEVLLCSLLDLYQYILRTIKTNQIYLIGNCEGCFPVMLLVESCRKQKLSISGVILMNPCELQTSKFHSTKYDGCVLSSNIVQIRGKAKKLAKKFHHCKEIFFNTTELNLLEEETDKVLKSIVDIISIEIPDMGKKMNEEELILEKPSIYKDPFELINEIVCDYELSTILLNNGYFSLDIITLMGDDDINSLQINDKQKIHLKNVITSLQHTTSDSDLAPSSSLSSSICCTPSLLPSSVLRSESHSNLQFITTPVKHKRRALKGNISPLFSLKLQDNINNTLQPSLIASSSTPNSPHCNLQVKPDLLRSESCQKMSSSQQFIGKNDGYIELIIQNDEDELASHCRRKRGKFYQFTNNGTNEIFTSTMF